MTSKTPQEDLTKHIYDAMQLPWLSERHDAINQLIEAEASRRSEAMLDELEKLIDAEVSHEDFAYSVVSWYKAKRQALKGERE